MAASLPTDDRGMRAIKGVGEAKLEKYGPLFIKEIEDYLRELRHD
jgi:superfamily II DNA helicase RecQ